MKLIIAGSRALEVPVEFLEYSCQAFALKPLEIVSGGASGVDSIAERYAEKYNYIIKIFRANWDKYGRSAGPLRNKEMAKYADALLIIWDGQSKGSSNMKKEAMLLGKPIYEVVLKQYN